MGWFLIHSDTIKEIQAALQRAALTSGSSVVTIYRDALLGLDSGLRTTDVVPADHQESPR